MPPVIDSSRCSRCGMCVDVCPADVFYRSEDSETPAVTYGEDCYFCCACILECHEDAIVLRYPLYAQPSYATDT